MNYDQCAGKWPDKDPDRLGYGPTAAEDNSINPGHYKRGQIEVWDFILDQKLDYLLGSALKYICRHDLKGAPIQDLEKAKAFIDRKIKQIKDDAPF